ncbi:MAG: zf-HC2 domain-containing protein, partial [Eubacteriales bacterium]|nr:zf-HC2 domain-containing protein [Eubacteriales bacterium]
VCAFLIEHKKQLTILAADFSDWSDKISYNANVLSIILAGGMVIGIILLVIGFVKRNQRKS